VPALARGAAVPFAFLHLRCVLASASPPQDILARVLLSCRRDDCRGRSTCARGFLVTAYFLYMACYLTLVPACFAHLHAHTRDATQLVSQSRRVCLRTWWNSILVLTYSSWVLVEFSPTVLTPCSAFCTLHAPYMHLFVDAFGRVWRNSLRESVLCRGERTTYYRKHFPLPVC